MVADRRWLLALVHSFFRAINSFGAPHGNGNSECLNENKSEEELGKFSTQDDKLKKPKDIGEAMAESMRITPPRFF